MSQYITAIDPHPDNVFIEIFDRDLQLKTVKTFRLPQGQFQDYFDYISTIENKRLIHCLEDINGTGRLLREELQKRNLPVIHVPPKKVAAFKQANKNRKSDHYDCWYIAQCYLSNPDFKPIELQQDEAYYLELREVAQLRYDLGLETNNIKRKINSRIKKYYQGFKFKNKNWGIKLIREGIIHFSKQKEPLSIVMKWLFVFMLVSELAKKELVSTLKEMKNEAVDSLMNIHGFGLPTASLFTAIVMLGKHPKNAGALSAWCGAGPVDYSSSNTQKHKCDYHKHPILNHILHQTTAIAAIPEGPTKAYIQRKLQEGNSPKMAKRKAKRVRINPIFNSLKSFFVKR